MYKSKEGQKAKWRSDRTLELLAACEAEGCNSCAICDLSVHPWRCNSSNCYAWETWFRGKWRNIREAARRKGYNV